MERLLEREDVMNCWRNCLAGVNLYLALMCNECI